MNSITRPEDQSTPIRPLPRLTGQLNGEAVLSDFGVESTRVNLRAVPSVGHFIAIGKSLVSKLGTDTRTDGSFIVPDTAESKLVQIVYLSNRRPTGIPSSHNGHAPGAFCSCHHWRVHHLKRDLLTADRNWLCPHGAAVLLGSGFSRTYLDWLTLPKKVKCPPEGTV